MHAPQRGRPRWDRSKLGIVLSGTYLAALLCCHAAATGQGTGGGAATGAPTTSSSTSGGAGTGSSTGSSSSSGAGPSSGSSSGGVDAGPPSTPCTTPASCLQRFTIPGTSFQLPYYGTYSVTDAHAPVTEVVVFVQGLQRDAENDFSTMLTAAQTAGALPHVLLLTPHFEALVGPGNVPCTGNPDQPVANDLLWSCDTWSDGEAATNAPSITSYGALDALIDAAVATFPSLTRVTVSGFSAGGQTTQRYAAANRADHGTSGPPFRYVVGDPSSYLYFDTHRPVDAANCTPSGCPDGFAVFDAGACPGFNAWKYGTEALTGAAAGFTPAALENAFTSRNVTYLLGMLDNAATTLADYADLDTSCPAEAQGPFRYQRGLAFVAYATSLVDAGSPKVEPIPGCGHSPSCVFQSAAGVAAVFGP